MSSNKDTPPNSSQRVQPAEDQKFKQMSLCGSFSFRTPHPHIHTYIHTQYRYTCTHIHICIQIHEMCTDIYIRHLSLQVPGSVPLLSIPMIPYPSLSLQYHIAHGPSSLLDNKSPEAGDLNFCISRHEVW